MLLNVLRRVLVALRSFNPQRAFDVNYRIVHQGMDFPIGSVLPASTFAGGVDGHLQIGSVVATRDPVNVALPGALTAPTAALSGSPNGDLKAELIVQAGKVAELDARNAALADEKAALESQLAQLKTEHAAALELIEHKESHRLQTAPVG